jgi:hypothetical protein
MYPPNSCCVVSNNAVAYIMHLVCRNGFVAVAELGKGLIVSVTWMYL